MSEAKSLTITPVATAPQLVHIDMNTLMLEAVKSPQGMETLERLVALRLQLEQEAARKSFFAALAGFQRDCPVIPRVKIVRDRDGAVRYCYAPTETIVQHIKEPLAAHELSYTLDLRQEEKKVTGICIVHHIDGHHEHTEVTVPVMVEHMNAAQAVISARTYATRVALCNALGIATADEDDDGNASGPVPEARQAARGGRTQNTAPRNITNQPVEIVGEPQEVQGTVQDAPPPVQEPQAAKQAERITKDAEGNEIGEAQVRAVADKCRAGVTMLNKAKLNGNQVLADADLAPTIRRIKQMEEAMEYDDLKSTYVDLRKLWDDYNAKKGETHG